MKYDVESILEMYEDDYIPSSKVPGPRNIKLAEISRSEMDNFNTPDLEQSPDSFLRPGETLEDFDVTFRRPNAQGGMQQLVQPNADGLRPGYSGQKKTIKGTGKNAGNITTYVGGRDNQIRYIGSQEYIDKIRKDNPKFGLVGKTVNQKKADKASINKKAIIKNFKDNLGIDVEIGKNNLVTGKDLTKELREKINLAQVRARRRNPGQGSLKDPKFWEFYNKYYKDIEDKKIADAEKEAAKMKAKSPDFIAELDRPLTKGERIILNKSYDNIFLEEFDRLKNEGDLFSKTDLNRAVINRIANENPTIDIASGKGLDKVFNGDENHNQCMKEPMGAEHP